MNRNVQAVYIMVALMGLADSIWSNALLPAWLFILTDSNNEKVGVIGAAGSVAVLITALPVGIIADKIGKAKVCYFGGVVMLLGAVGTVLLAINPFGWDNDFVYIQFIITQIIWGVASGIASGPAQALFADSIHEGGRSTAYMYLQLAYMIPSLCGPILSIILFKVYGDTWTLDQMRPIFLVGVAFDFPAAIALFFLSDELAVRDDDDVPQVAGVPLGDSVVASDSMKEPLLSSGTKKTYGWRIPLTMFFGEVVIAIGAGMTVKYGALFFKKDVELSPVGVQLVFMGTTLAIAFFTVSFQGVGKCIGRVQAAFVARFIGLAMLTTMSCLVLNGFKMWYYIAPLYCFRSGLMNCTYPLDESVLMDYVPKSSRAKWKSLESIGSLGWAGSAVLGGLLADEYDYSTTFLITVGFQALGALIHLSLVTVVPREKQLDPSGSTTSPQESDLIKEPIKEPFKEPLLQKDE